MSESLIRLFFCSLLESTFSMRPLPRSFMILAIAIALTLNANASSHDKEDFTVLLENGTVCGHLVLNHRSQKRIEVDYECVENGRGANTHEVITLTPSSSMKTYRVTGTSEMGGKIEETFVQNAHHARWKSSSEEGQAKVQGYPFYVPMNSTYAVNSLMITALNQSPSKVLRLFPSGELRQDKLDELTLTRGQEKLKVQLLMLSGLGLKPDFFWATTGASPRFFAFTSPGYSVFLEPWRASLKTLKERQSSVIDQMLANRAKQTRHPIEGTLVVKHARIFISELGQLTEPKNIYIKDGRILKISNASTEPINAESEVDAKGQILLPALVDMHAHINSWSASYNMANGVTTIRDMGNVNEEVQQLMRRVKDGTLLSPNIVASGLIEGKSEYANSDGIMIENLQEAQKAVDYYFNLGYPHIKIYSSFPKAIVKDIVDYSHSKGMTVGGHVPAFMSSEEAIEAGFDEINHINQLLLHLVSNDKTDSRTLDRFYLPAEKFADLDLNSPPIQRLIQLLKDKHVTVDPTLAGFDFLKQRDGEWSAPFVSIMDHLPPDTQREFKVGTMQIPNEETAQRYRKSYEKMVEFTGLLHREGIPIVAGTDTFAGFGLHSELALYVKAGLTPAQAIKVATFDAAKRLGALSELGSVEEGKRAELILVKGQPTQSIEDLRRITLILSQGHAIYPNEIYPLIGVKPFIDEQAKVVRK